MTILGIEEISYGASDLATCERFFLDWGLALVHSDETRRVFECLNGCRVIVADPARCSLPTPLEAGPTLHEVVWGVASADELAALASRLQGQPGFVQGIFDGQQRVGCTDPNGLALKVQVTAKRAIDVASGRYNTWSQTDRIDQRAPAYERAQPIEVGHVVFFVPDVAAGERFHRRRSP